MSSLSIRSFDGLEVKQLIPWPEWRQITVRELHWITYHGCLFNQDIVLLGLDRDRLFRDDKIRITLYLEGIQLLDLLYSFEDKEIALAKHHDIKTRLESYLVELTL